jgi:hypothetical protein
VIAQQPEKESLRRDASPDPAAVRLQLRRLLAHPLFTNSKRYPVFLAYAVEQTLLGHSSGLKERSIGIEAFGRKPDYDANADPIVRTTAAEVRKRLVQYYYDSSHAGELVIELSSGSYIPTFRQPRSSATDRSEDDTEVMEPESAAPDVGPAQANTPALSILAPPEPMQRRKWATSTGRGWATWIAALVLAATISFALGFRNRAHSLSAIDLFWEPVVSTPGPTTYVLGEPDQQLLRPGLQPASDSAAASPEDELQTQLRFSGRMNMSDVVTLTYMIAPLASRHGAFRVLPASEANFAQLREGPIVLIGAFDNPWTLRLTQGLRFGFEDSGGFWRLVDHTGKQGPWTVKRELPIQKLTVDYAIVARIHDKTTGEPVIIVAGISDQGTEAASEVAYNPIFLDSLLDKAPSGWAQRNLEAVIETHVIEGHPGPPDVLAVDSW